MSIQRPPRSLIKPSCPGKTGSARFSETSGQDRCRDLSAQLNWLSRLLPKIQRAYRLGDRPKVIEALNQERDTWIFQAEFIKPNRRVVYLLRLNLYFVDLDTDNLHCQKS